MGRFIVARTGYACRLHLRGQGFDGRDGIRKKGEKMNACRLAFLAGLVSVSLAPGLPASAQDPLPLEGPGLGNLTYTDAELFREISTIKWNTATNTNGIPVIQYTIPGNTSPQK